MNSSKKILSKIFFRRRGKFLFLVLIASHALIVRGLTAQFIYEHINDAAWFPYGIYAAFDQQAQNILDGKAGVFWIEDPDQTDRAVYPPGYPLWLSLIYSVSGVRSIAVVQLVQWILDAASVWLIVGIGVTAFGWRAGISAGILASLSPLLAFYGATPLADAPASWIVLAGVWMLVLAFKREDWRWALLAGLAIGLSCWLRANAMLLAPWVAASAVFFLTQIDWKKRIRIVACLLFGAILAMTPLVVRNVVTFRAFVPTGLGVGTNLWEGIGETDRAAEFGAIYGDASLAEKERAEMNIPPDQKFNLYYPNGVERDRARAKKALAVIADHPVWYLGVMARRAARVLKYDGGAAPYVGTSGFNVTSGKCLPAAWQDGGVAMSVNILGGIQYVMRHLALPLMLIGIFLTLRRDFSVAASVLVPALYYLIVGSFMHTEIRYGLPMQATLFVFAGYAISRLPRAWFKLKTIRAERNEIEK